MKEQIELVRAFMHKAEQDTPERPCIPNERIQLLRLKLHQEEAVTELSEAFERLDKIGILDSICDTLVVVFGTALACGFSAEQVEASFTEVMRSNMTKFIDGYKHPATGKWIKGPSYSPANLLPIVNK